MVYVLIGGFAVIVQGYERLTADIDLCYERSRDNIRRLVRVLVDLHAEPRAWPEGLPFLLDEEPILNGDTLTLSTDLGPVDIMGTPDGTHGFKDLAASQELYEIAPGLTVAVASIPDLIRMKRASSTQSRRARKDLDDIEALSALAQMRSRRDSGIL